MFPLCNKSVRSRMMVFFVLSLSKTPHVVPSARRASLCGCASGLQSDSHEGV